MNTKIATNLITGFLGAGKTSAILQLLASKTDAEPWAVLVNEFGEVGIDGALLAGQGATVREVPGGCLCCTGNVSLQVALGALLRQARPKRLLIEPTGLGHPLEILRILNSPTYRGLLDLRTTVTLVDPRKLSDPRYRGHEIFRQQIEVADLLLANKSDLCSEDELVQFARFAEQQGKAWQATRYGQLALAQLDQPSPLLAEVIESRQTPLEPLPLAYEELTEVAAEPGYLRREGGSGPFPSCGWIFHSRFRFDYETLFSLLCGLPVLRLKAVMITERGCYSFNAEEGLLSVNPLQPSSDSRIELIHDEPLDWAVLQQQLLACVVE